MKRWHRWTLLIVVVLGLPALVWTQVSTFPRLRLSGRNGTLATVNSSGQLAITTATPTADAQAPSSGASAFPRVRLSDGTVENLVAVNASGSLHVTCTDCGGALTPSTGTTLTGLVTGDGANVNAIANVATGQVLTSGTPPAWSASPQVSNEIVRGTSGAEQAPALTAGNWTVGSGWESPIVGPGLIKNADGTGTQTPSAATTIIANTVYKVTFTVANWTVGSFSYTLGGNAGTASPGANGTFTQWVLTGTTGKLIITPTNTSRFTISAISIVPITEGALTADGTLLANSRLQVTGSASFGSTASPLPNVSAYINNLNGPGLIVKAGSTSGSRPNAIFGQSTNNSVKTLINESGAVYTVAWMVASGDFSATYSTTTGDLSIGNLGSSNFTSMFEARSDIDGAAIVASTPTANHSLNFISTDGGTAANGSSGTAARNINFGIDNDGKLRWGASAGSTESPGTRVGSVTVNSPGTSCTSAPTITPSGGGCVGQGSYVGFVSGGVLKRVEVVEPAYGCTSAPDLAISGGGGCTATVSANLMDTVIGRCGAGELCLGYGDATASPVGHTLRGPSGTGTDKNGGKLTLSAGAGTGTGRSWTEKLCYTTALSTGSSANTSFVCGADGVYKALSDGAPVNLINLTLANNTGNSIRIDYQVEVYNGTNVQVEDGFVICRALNQAGVFSGNTCTETSTQTLGAGTLTTTWAISGANPAVVSLNADTSLSPSTGYPRLRYNAAVLGHQALAVQ